MQEISLREINQHFSKYIRTVEKGEEIIITRRGKPIARLVAMNVTKKLTKEQKAARLRARKRMVQGYSLDIGKFDRDKVHERRTGNN